MSETSADPRKHVFIVGSSRSGTSAFARLLGHHGRIVMGMERYKSVPIETWPNDVWSRDRFLDPAATAGHGGFYRHQASKFDDAEWIGDKIPALINKMGRLRARYPDATVFCMLRDDAAVGLSYKAQAAKSASPFWANKTFADGVRSSRISQGHARNQILSGDPNFHIVDYDRIYPHDEAYLRAVLERLDLPADDAILAYYAGASRRAEEVRDKPRDLTDEERAELERSSDPDLFAFCRAHAIGAVPAA